MEVCECRCGTLIRLDVGDVWKCTCGRTWQLIFDADTKRMKLDFLGLRKEETCKS